MRSLAYTLMLVALASAAYLGARYWQTSREGAVLNVGSACDIGAATCRHELPNRGRVSIDISPRPVPLMQAVTLGVETRDTPLQPEYLEITGLNMEMGINRVPLEPVGEGRWQGETIIPICSQRRMHWRAALVLRDGGTRYRVEDEFYTLRP